jgi:hypothetical protein
MSINDTNSTINTHSYIHPTSSYILVEELVWQAGPGQLCQEQLQQKNLMKKLRKMLLVACAAVSLFLSDIYCGKALCIIFAISPFYILDNGGWGG